MNRISLVPLAGACLIAASIFTTGPTASAAPPPRWRVVFRSTDPSIWNTDESERSERFAISLGKVSEHIRYVRLTRADNGTFVILRIDADDGLALVSTLELDNYVWNGTCRHETMKTKSNYLLGVARKDWFREYKNGVFVLGLPDIREGYSGWGFAKEALVYSDQAYAWAGRPIKKTAFEIAVNSGELLASERVNLLNSDTPQSPRLVTLLKKLQPAPTETTKAKTTKDDTPRPPRVAGTVDADSQKDAKKFARTQSSIKGLYVIRTEAGLRVGGSQDIIATAERASSDRETICDFVTEVGKDTDISMEEAARLLKVRYPVWQAGYKIRFSYSNKYTKQAGGSAGGAFSVLLLSLLDGVQIDPAFAMTGDVTVDGKIREVGAVAEKIRGATLDRCRVIAIPEANKESLNDLVILYSQAMLWSAQIVSITTLDDAAAVARVDRKPELAKAMELFGQVQRSLGANATPFALRSPGIVQTLQQVLQLAPNHLSAEFMLRAAGGRMPQTLGLGGSLEEIWAAAGPLLGFLFSDYKEPEKSKRYYFDKVPTATFKAGMERLNWLQFRLHPKTLALKMAMAEYMTSLDQMHRQSSFSAGSLRQHLLKRDKVLSEAHTLGTDRKTLEEMLH